MEREVEARECNIVNGHNKDTCDSDFALLDEGRNETTQNTVRGGNAQGNQFAFRVMVVDLVDVE